MEKYTPKSWLDMIVDNKMCYDCTTANEVDKCAKDLIRAFDKIPGTELAIVHKRAPARSSTPTRKAKPERKK